MVLHVHILYIRFLVWRGSMQLLTEDHAHRLKVFIVAFARSFHSWATCAIASAQHFKNCHRGGTNLSFSCKIYVAIGCHVGPRSRLEKDFCSKKHAFQEPPQKKHANLPFWMIPHELARPQHLQCRRYVMFRSLQPKSIAGKSTFDQNLWILGCCTWMKTGAPYLMSSDVCLTAQQIAFQKKWFSTCSFSRIILDRTWKMVTPSDTAVCVIKV